MSWMLSTTTLLRPTTPIWLETICQQLIDNDTSYRTVEVIHPRMDDHDAKIFAKSLLENYTITTLILSFYSIVDDGTAAIGSVLSNNTTITKLQLRDIRDVREISTLFHYLQYNQTITDFSLRHCTICPRGAMAMSEYFKQNTSIHELRITDTQFIGNAFQILCDHGLHSHTNVRRLYFINDDLTSNDATQYISSILHQNSTLQELYLGENNIGDTGVEALVNCILKNNAITSLCHLDLRSNNITCTGAMSLQGLIVNNRSIQYLNLSNNEIGDHGIMAISRGIQQSSWNCQLQQLDINTNYITNFSAITIANMLKVNKSLNEFNISFNGLGDIGATTIISAMETNTTLRSLSIRRNGITDVGAECIAELLPNLKGLKELMLSKNDIGLIGATALLRGVQSNVELEYLQIDEKVTSSDCSMEKIFRDISHYLQLNKAGRRIFRSTIPISLWSYVYGRINYDKDMVSYFNFSFFIT
jgi:Ran GTPase-activating protein (RanGAP) involved in mRNA processing and transport